MKHNKTARQKQNNEVILCFIARYNKICYPHSNFQICVNSTQQLSLNIMKCDKTTY